MNKLETILAEAKVKTPLIVAQLNAKHEAKQKEQERLEALDIDWDFDFVIDRHGSDWVEYALVGYDKDEVKYFFDSLDKTLNYGMIKLVTKFVKNRFIKQ